MLAIKSDFILAGENLEEFKGYIKIKNNTITGLTRSKPLTTKFIDASDYIITPGFINSHTHIGDSAFKDLALNLNIQEIVKPPKGLKHVLLTKAKDELLIHNMVNSLQFMLSTGTTTFVDFREQGVHGIKLLQKALEKVKIKAIILGRPTGSDIDEILNVSNGLGLPSPTQYNSEYLKEASILAKRKNKLLAMHACEANPGELKKALIATPDFLVHLTNASKSELSLARKTHIPIVCCPRANAVLRIGFPPVKKLKKVMLGTDNVMLNSPNLLREMEFTFKHLQSRSISPKDILKMVTVVPGRILRLNTGIIEQNKLADLVFIDSKAKNMAPAKNLPNAIVLRAEPENIHKVLVNGEAAFERSSK